jgi:hypothetical protein
MKVDLSVLDGSESFMVHPHQVAGETVLLVQPTHIGAKWTPETLIFRSSVWNLKGELVSASFKKFFNWGEQPALCTPPESLNGAVLMEKLDGTTLIFSRYKNHDVIRTRGTVDARKQDNGWEIDHLLQKYPKFVKFLRSFGTSPHSYLFEWTSPSNQIVINYGDEPDMAFIGMIGHEDYFMQPQDMLDMIAGDFDLRRPKSYQFDSVESMKQAVTDFRGKEGVCVYFHGGQEILKFKSAQYLYLHRAKSEISSIEKVMDLYLDVYFNSNPVEAPTFSEFIEYLTNTFDYEIAQMAIPNVSQICDAMKEVKLIVNAMIVFVDPLRFVARRDAAAKILQAWGNTSRSSFAFKLLDGKDLGAEDFKKLLFQCLKK